MEIDLTGVKIGSMF